MARRSALLVAGLAALVTAGPLARAQQQQEVRREFSYDVTLLISNLDPLLNPLPVPNQPGPPRPDYTGALALIDRMLTVAEPGDSYDRSLLNLFKGQVLLQRSAPGDIEAAIPPLETVIDIGQRVPFLPTRDFVPVYQYLAQAYMFTVDALPTPAEKLEAITKAADYMGTYCALANPPSAQESELYSMILMQQAMAIDPNNPDIDLVTRAEEVARFGLLRSVQIRPQLYDIIIFSRQQHGDWQAMADQVEAKLARNPNDGQNRQYWLQLPTIYLNLAGEAEDRGEDPEPYRLRAIMAYERGRDIGLYSTKEQYQSLRNIAVVYGTVGQYTRAAELLLDYLEQDLVPDEELETAWRFAATYLQQAYKDKEALGVLNEASEALPTVATFDKMATSIYMELNRVPEAYAAAVRAAEKAEPDEKAGLWATAAWLAYDQERFDDAMAAVSRGLAAPGGDQDQMLRRLKEAVDYSIEVRDAAREKM